MGFFSDLQREDYDRSYSDWELVRRLAVYFGKHGRRLIVTLLATIVMAGAAASTPILFSIGVELLEENPQNSQLYGIALALFALGIVFWLTNWARRRAITRVIGNVMLDLRKEAFSATASHDMSFYDEHASGKVVSRITSDTNEFAQVSVLLTELATQMTQVVILILVLFSIDVRLSLLVLTMLPVLFLTAWGFRRWARRVIRNAMRAVANVNSSIKEAVTGITVAKNFRQEEAIYWEFEAVNRQSYSVNIRRGFVLALVFPTLNALMFVGTAVVVYIGGLSAAQGAIAVGAWYLFLRSLDRFWFPVLNLSSFWSQIQGGLSAAERVFALIDAESAVFQTARLQVPKLRGEIHFAKIGFHYRPDEPVLEDFSLTIKPGEDLALVGHTGAGKSSIVKLVTRFYEFQGGQISIDGHDIRSLDLRDYRRQIGLVPQNPFLFSGTVLENIRYARPEVSEYEIEELARRIGSGEWMDALPDGLNSEVGERGKRLSMGQRQLVSLMRVLVQRPAIFVLDEATASVDPFTESQIQQALQLILADTTSILIAHRLSTVRASDRIIVLRQGSIIEEGDHQRLLDSGGHYAELYNTYFRHQAPDYRPTHDATDEDLGFVEVKVAFDDQVEEMGTD
ncbi:MAG: ABC transporter ATP-binding protein [Anaerolineales bacterium]